MTPAVLNTRTIRGACASVILALAATGAQGQQIAKLIAADAAVGDFFGWRVSLSGDTAVVGAQFDDDAGSNSGSAHVFREAGGAWPKIAKLTADDAAAEDRFGSSVSIHGDTAVVGAPLEDDAGNASGSAYVFREAGGAWQQIAKLTADDAAAEDQFGSSVSIHGDTAVVGAQFDDDAGNASGSAYVFREAGGVWQQIAKLTADDAAGGDEFGASVSLSGDTAVIGALHDDDAGFDSGSAYVFREVGGVWQQIAKLTADDAAEGDEFGVSVSLSGETTVVGARFDDDAVPGDPACSSGSAYVFREIGGEWQQIAKLTPDNGECEDVFGSSVSIDGDTAVVGALQDDDAGFNSGSAYVFREVRGVWQQTAKLLADDAAPSDTVGRSVSISGDTAVLGAPLDDDAGSSSGSAYVFREVGRAWQQSAKLTAGDAEAFDNFGFSVSLSGDTALVGAPSDDDAGSLSGSAYVFRDVGGAWPKIAKLTADDAPMFDRFAESVSLSGHTALVGAPLDDDAGTLSGSAYVFREVGGVWQQIAKLTADDAADGDEFGVSVSLSGDTALVGAQLANNDAGSPNGAAYVFREAGGAWQQFAKLTAADGVLGDGFGVSVSISGDTALIGAPSDDDAGSASGAAYVFRPVGGAWQQIAKLTAADAATFDRFGESVSISGDTAIVGAFQDDDAGFNSGSAYVFREVGGAWQQIAKLTADDAAGADQFGASVSISGDDRAVIGARFDDDRCPGLPDCDSGSAYVFREVDGAWRQIDKLTAADAAFGDSFGAGVSLGGDTAVVGAPLENDAGSNSGSAYVFAVGSPCPADLNADSTLDVLDFIAFQTVFAQQDPAADCNEDTQFDVLDFICFQDLFIAGCE